MVKSIIHLVVMSSVLMLQKIMHVNKHQSKQKRNHSKSITEVLSAKTTRQCVVKQIEEPKEPEVTERVIVQEVLIIQFV